MFDWKDRKVERWKTYLYKFTLMPLLDKYKKDEPKKKKLKLMGEKKNNNNNNEKFPKEISQGRKVKNSRTKQM